MKILIPFVILVFAGCSTVPANLPKPLPLVTQKQTVVIPPELLVNCQPMTQLTPSTAYNQGSTVDVIRTWSAQHQDCMSRFQKLRDLTAKAFNINIDAQGNEIPTPSTVTVAK